MNPTSTRLRRTGAGVAVGALVASALLFAPPVQAADPTAITSVRESDIAKDATNYAGWHQDAAAGQPRVINEGLELIGPSRVINGYTNNGSDELGETNRNVDIETLADAKITKTGDAILQVPLHVQLGETTTTATLFSADPATNKWQTDTSIVGETSTLSPSADYTVAEVKAAIGEKYRVRGFGVNIDAGTSAVSSIVFNGTQYLFGNTAPVVRDVSVSTKINTPVNVALAATDADGNALKYTVTSATNGSLTTTGTDRTFTPTKNFTGNAVVKYTVDDERGGLASATITIKVKKLASKVSIYRIHPTSGKITTKSKVHVYAAITVDGKAAPRGSAVYVYAKSKKVGSGKVNSLGKVKLSLPNKLPKGKSTLKVTKVGSKSTNGSSASVVVRLKK